MEIPLLLLLAWGVGASADNFTTLCADRAAVERVYHQHRLGEKPPFDQALPRATLERLVRDELRKEAALKQAYGVTVTPAMVESEVQRINSTTRAPDILAEIKAALGNDPARFACAMVRPIVVERLLRQKFDNDDHLHAPQRREMERVRSRLTNTVTELRRGPTGAASAKVPERLDADPGTVVSNLVGLLKQAPAGEFTETTWRLGARPAETSRTSTADEVEIRKRFGSQAPLLSAPGRDPGKESPQYFEDLPGDLQNVLRVQLRQPGDVSVVIEMPGGFLLYMCKARTADTLTVAALSLRKRSYEEWLAAQPGGER